MHQPIASETSNAWALLVEEAPAKSVFSDRMRKVEPILAREKDNHLFQAIHRQQYYLKKRNGSVFLLFVKLGPVGYFCYILGSILASGLPSPLTMDILLNGDAFFAVFGAFLVGYYSIHQERQKGSINQWMERIQTRSSLTDLWLAGISGRTILEAMYLAKRWTAIITALGWSIFLLIIMQLALIGLIHLLGNAPFYTYPQYWVAQLLLLAFCNEVRHYLLAVNMQSTRDNQIKIMLINWKRNDMDKVYSGSLTSMIGEKHYFMCVVLAIVLVGYFICLVSPSIDIAYSTMAWVGIGMVVVTMSLMVEFRLKELAIAPVELERLLAFADEAFEEYIQREEA